MADADNKGPPKSFGRIIRGTQPGEASELEAIAATRPPIRTIIGSEEFQASSKAQAIIEEAKQKAAELLAEAERQREHIFQEARQAALEDVAAEAGAELAKAKMQAGSMLSEVKKELIELACTIAQKIIGRDLEREPKLLLEICANAIENVRAAKAMLLRIHPKDAKLLREKRAELVELIGRSIDIAIRDDAEVQPGGCIVQTEFGTIDAQLETQFRALRTLFEEDAAGGGD